MKHSLLYLFLFLSITCFSWSILWAQENKQPTVLVHLKDGSTLKGKLNEKTKLSDMMSIETENGNTIFFNQSNVERIEVVVDTVESDDETVEKEIPKIKRPKTFKNKGIYNISSLGFLPGIKSANTFVLGFSMHHIFGYQFNRFIATGVGGGIDRYNPYVLAPVYLDLRGYVLNSSATPYYAFQSGYGFALPGTEYFLENEVVVKKEGGLMFSPSVGFRFSSAKGNHFIFEYGYKFQRAIIHKENEFWDPIIEGSDENAVIIERKWFQRSMIKFGLLF